MFATPRRRALAPLCALALAATTQAQITSIPPFQGDFHESFEEVTVLAASSLQLQDFRILAAPPILPFGGEIFFVNTPVFGTCGYSSPSGGKYATMPIFGALGASAFEFEFDRPVRRFGALFGEEGASAPPTITAYDEAGDVIGTLPTTIPGSCMTPAWFGIESIGAGIARVRVERGLEDGGMLVDDVRGEYYEVGTNYCGPAPLNSSGSSAAMSVEGSDLVALNDVRLVATELPPQSTGYFLAARAQGFVPSPGGSQGNLCLGGPIGRFSGLAEIQNSGAAGEIALQIDLGFLPTPTGRVAAAPGETWTFQAWFRDANPAPTSNFTDGLVVTFR